MTSTDPTAKYVKDLALMRTWLDAKEFYVAGDAMEYAREFHCGVRKDAITPEFAHQIFIANYLRTLLPSLSFPEETLASVFLHDVPEDFDVGFEEIEARFGPVIGEATKLLTKKHRGVVVPYEIYFPNLARNAIGSLVKGTDRAHNVFTMGGAKWSMEKQEKYLDEVDRWFLPMLKTARRTFKPQLPAYENIKTVLNIQAHHIRHSIEQGRALRDMEEAAESPAPAFA